MIRSYGSKISITLSDSSRTLCRITFTYGLTSAIDSLADSALDLPMSETPWMIWRCRLEQRRGAEAARANDEHLRVLQALLPGHADVGDNQVARVALHLVDRQIRGRFNERWQRHCANSSQVEVSSSGVNRVPPPGIPVLSTISRKRAAIRSGRSICPICPTCASPSTLAFLNARAAGAARAGLISLSWVPH